ncbi:MAG: low specificity L-threonine aldolase [Parvibaculaceae bacterium]
MNDRDTDLRESCTRTLSSPRRGSARETLIRLANMPLAEKPSDYFGEGEILRALEMRTAAILGKEDAMFFAKGIIAQYCLLRVRSEERSSPYVVLSPMSHIDREEGNGIEVLHGLRPIRLGQHWPFTLKSLQAVSEKLCAVVVELPLRRAGYLLPSWSELEGISGWCRERGIPFHIDGARLWEAAAGYGRTPQEVASLADSVYVSFYKGLGGLAGCALAGTADTIKAMRTWRVRLGGLTSIVSPYVLAATDGLDRQLPRMPAYVARARSLASAIHRACICTVHPHPPHVNAFQVIFDGAVDELTEKHRRFATQNKVWLFNAFGVTALENRSMAEIVIGDAADGYSDEEACGWLQSFLRS